MTKKKRRSNPKFRKKNDPLYQVMLKYSENSVSNESFRLFLPMMKHYLDQHDKFYIQESYIMSLVTGELIHTFKSEL